MASSYTFTVLSASPLAEDLASHVAKEVVREVARSLGVSPADCIVSFSSRDEDAFPVEQSHGPFETPTVLPQHVADALADNFPMGPFDAPDVEDEVADPSPSDDSEHPRDEHGRFIPRDSLEVEQEEADEAAVARDSDDEDAADLPDPDVHLSDPEDHDAIVSAIEDFQAGRVDDAPNAEEVVDQDPRGQEKLAPEMADDEAD
jgi:hypothetical protein